MDIKQAIKEVQQGNLVGTLEAADIAKVITMGVPAMVQKGDKWVVHNYQAIDDATGVNYNRGWLLVRRAFLLINDPGSLVDLQAAVPAAVKAQAAVVAKLEAEIKAAPASKVDHLRAVQAMAQYDFKRHVVAPAVVQQRMTVGISWGEISVRLNTPESTCRGAFNLVSDRKDRGLRIGKGGRYAYGDATLYQDNRKKEGAHISSEQKMRPKPEDLLNFIKKEQGQTKQDLGAKRRLQITKLLAKAYDSAVGAEERNTFEAKANELIAKYGFKRSEFKAAPTEAAKAS